MPIVITVPTEATAAPYHNFVRITNAVDDVVDLVVPDRATAEQLAIILDNYLTNLFLVSDHHPPGP